MLTALDYWKFLAGLGLFLFGMTRLEVALKELAGKRFKKFLRKYTSNRFVAIINGAFATAILQSSSVVMLMVIAFAGAGIISLSNSLGIILGANLGTTMTGWIVTLIGFNSNLDSLIFPLIGIGSLGLIFVSYRFVFYHFFGFLIAFGLLLMGLGLMKEGMGQIASIFPIEELQKYGLFSFLLFGFFVTALMHSSSAMMTITLSALFANVITIIPALYIVIGAELGTTMSGVLASQRGTAIKKRVGLAHLFFNLGTAVLALLILIPFFQQITAHFGISDHLIALVFFHSGMNFLGILVFFPFLGLFEKFLNRFFQNSEDKVCQYIHKVEPDVPEAAIVAIRLELNEFIHRVFRFNCNLLGFQMADLKFERKESFVLLRSLLNESDISRDYQQIKRTEGELLEYFNTVQREKLESIESEALSRSIFALRNGVQSAKSAKDIDHNLKDFQQSVLEIVEKFTFEIHKDYFPVLKSFSEILNTSSEQSVAALHDIQSFNENAYRKVNDWIYLQTKSLSQIDSAQIATFLNVNREISNSQKLLIESLQDILLVPKG